MCWTGSEQQALRVKRNLAARQYSWLAGKLLGTINCEQAFTCTPFTCCVKLDLDIITWAYINIVI